MNSAGKVVNSNAASTDGDALIYGQASGNLAGLSIDTNPLTMGGQKVTGAAPGSASGEVVTWEQLTSVAAGLDFKESVRAATAAALPAYTRVGNVITADANGALPSIDTSVSLIVGNRMLLQDGAAGADNGLYEVTALGDGSNPFVLTRTFDADSNAEVTSGMAFHVEEGTVNGNQNYVLTTNDPITLNTTALTFTVYNTLADLIAGTGCVISGNTLNVGGGDGIVANADDVAVDLDTTPGLGFTGGKLHFLPDPNGGLERNASGSAVKLNGTTLQLAAAGLSVKGLSSLFEIATVAVGATVTAANLDTLTDASNADALHTHTGLTVDEAKKVENDFNVDEAVAAGDPVYWTATGDRIGKCLANDVAKSKVIGVARTAQATPGSPAPVVSDGSSASGVLSSATPGDIYFLADAGGLSTSAPSSGNRYLQIGIAQNATDLFVQIFDYGKAA
jgi:hypothetical protein